MFLLILVLIIVLALSSLGVQLYIRRVVKVNLSIPVQNNATAAEIAQQMLAKFNVHDVQIQVNPQLMLLGDAYNNNTKTIYLSSGIADSKSLAGYAIACHEAGHAIQHAQQMHAIPIRNAILPFAQVASGFIWILVLIAIFTWNPFVAAIALACFGLVAMFQLCTLPLEFDASRRALKYLKQENLLATSDYPRARHLLTLCALTYIIALLATLAKMAMLLLWFLPRR